MWSWPTFGYCNLGWLCSSGVNTAPNWKKVVKQSAGVKNCDTLKQFFCALTGNKGSVTCDFEGP